MHQGWDVIPADSAVLAVSLIYERRFDALLLCNTLMPQSKERLAVLYRELNPGGKVLVVRGEAFGRAKGDVVLEQPLSPEMLIDAARELDVVPRIRPAAGRVLQFPAAGAKTKTKTKMS